MRSAWLVVLASSVAGAGAAAQSTANKPAASDDPDKGFAEYAAAHGIEALSGGGATAEVTADGLRFEALDKEKPVKLDGMLLEWPAPAKATTVTKGATKAGL